MDISHAIFNFRTHKNYFQAAVIDTEMENKYKLRLKC